LEHNLTGQNKQGETQQGFRAGAGWAHIEADIEADIPGAKPGSAS
jgi:hypothetical protein